MNAADLLKQMSEGKESGGGNYIPDGKYTLILDVAEIEKKRSCHAFIAELIVEESEDVFVDSNKLNEGENAPKAAPPGTRVTFFEGDNKEGWEGRVRAFTRGLANMPKGTDDELVQAEGVKVYIDGKYRGYRVYLETYRNKPTKSGVWIPKQNWQSHPNTEADVRSGLDILEGKAPAPAPAPAPDAASEPDDDPLAAAK